MLDSKNFNNDWQFLRVFFGLRVLRYLVTWFAVVPIALVIFRDVPEVVRLQVSEKQEIALHLTLPFKWAILWFSSLLYVLAWALYIFFSPHFVRRYQHYGAYQSWLHSERWIIWEWNDFLKRRAALDAPDILIEKNLATPATPAPDLTAETSLRSTAGELLVFKPKKEADETWFFFQRNQITYRLGLGPNVPDASVKHSELFWELYGAEASSRPYARVAIWIILGAAALLFSIAVLQNIWAVIRYFIS